MTIQRMEAEWHLPQPLDFLGMVKTDPPPLDFVLPGFLSGTVGSLVSPGGAGKSMLALQLVCQIAGGQNTTGIESAEGKVLYIVAEDSPSIIHHRISAISLLSSIPPDIGKRIDIVPVDSINIIDPTVANAITHRAEGCRLIIMDTLRRFHNEDENDGRAMVAVITTMECIAHSTGASILFLHHASKSSVMNGNGGDQQASRGSSVLTDNIRWQAFLCGMNEKQAKKSGIGDQRCYYVRFGVSKMNYDKPVQNVWFRRGEGGVLVPDCLVDGLLSPTAIRREVVDDEEDW